ncbi:MAG TPA: NADPH-dependent F420 reductase [Pirellulaceae bacterium]|jgi:hypothetical protein|nr:NADPH-dependent F420 reductase [Pirellulaceae bacterium]
MEIAVLGAGRVGTALARGWTRAGRTVALGSRDPAAAQAKLDAMGVELPTLTYADAAIAAETVVLALPYPACVDVAAGLGELAGKVVIDCCNPLNEQFSGLAIGHDDSAAERIARRLPRAFVVKAFNTVSVATMENPHFPEGKASVFYCGDDAGAKGRVDRLAVDLGFEAHDAGPLKSARYLEPLAMLYIHLAMHENWTFPFAFGILKRDPSDGRPIASGGD